MTVSTSKNGTKGGTRIGGSASPPEPPAPGSVTATSIHSRGDLTDLPVPHYLLVTPFWFRVFAAGLMAIAAVLSLFALTHVLSGPAPASDLGGSLRMAVGVALAMLLCGMAFRFCNPLDRRKWFRLALTRAGLYFPGRKSSLVLVPWSALVAVDVERWYGKGEHSAARLRLDLDEESWSRFSRGARIEGKGRVRCISVHVVDMTGDELADRIRACRADSQPPRG
jgi:hypothetical protein